MVVKKLSRHELDKEVVCWLTWRDSLGVSGMKRWFVEKLGEEAGLEFLPM
jgi:hypothetical protein